MLQSNVTADGSATIGNRMPQSDRMESKDRHNLKEYRKELLRRPQPFTAEPRALLPFQAAIRGHNHIREAPWLVGLLPRAAKGANRPTSSTMTPLPTAASREAGARVKVTPVRGARGEGGGNMTTRGSAPCVDGSGMDNCAGSWSNDPCDITSPGSTSGASVGLNRLNAVGPFSSGGNLGGREVLISECRYSGEVGNGTKSGTAGRSARWSRHDHCKGKGGGSGWNSHGMPFSLHEEILLFAKYVSLTKEEVRERRCDLFVEFCGGRSMLSWCSWG
ncbi:unnamed protein product [Choristocarpus tenellus]